MQTSSDHVETKFFLCLYFYNTIKMLLKILVWKTTLWYKKVKSLTHKRSPRILIIFNIKILLLKNFFISRISDNLLCVHSPEWVKTNFSPEMTIRYDIFIKNLSLND